MTISIIIRTLNEEAHIHGLITAIHEQNIQDKVEIVLVDSGSKDNTINIAQKLGSKIVHITPAEFSFGRSLNYGIKQASGEIIVLISGHCLPQNKDWLQNLIAPLKKEQIHYAYGKQIGGKVNQFSECQLFSKYYPDYNIIPQNNIFCNNANAALSYNIWTKYKFNEELTGLEDMDLAKRLLNDGLKIGYCSNAVVYHYHNESLIQIKRRFEREAIGLQFIMPEIHISVIDCLGYIMSGIFYDCITALKQRRLLKNFIDIMLFRLMQYWGSYKGNQRHRVLSAKQKHLYFYPKGFKT